MNSAKVGEPSARYGGGNPEPSLLPVAGATTFQMRKRRYTDKQLQEAVATSYTIRAVLDKIGLTPVGGNYEMIQKRIQELGLDTSHFLGSAILKGTTHDYNTRPLEQILIEGKIENTWRLKNRLIQEGHKEHRCESCGATEWQEKPIPLELHHIDGNRQNNSLSNIKLLCPNCHALTDNYRGGNKKV